MIAEQPLATCGWRHRPQRSRRASGFRVAPLSGSALQRLATCLLTLVLCACTGVDRIAPAAPPAPPGESASGRSSADELLGYLARLRLMSDSALSAEVARQRRAAAREPSNVARLQVALALALSAQSDEADILSVVEPLEHTEADSAVRAMASFLHTLATERRRLKETAGALGARLRDERRAHEAQKQRADALQQKLDALTELEKSLSDRQNLSR